MLYIAFFLEHLYHLFFSQPHTVVCSNGIVACWHPDPPFPYKHTRPIDLKLLKKEESVSRLRCSSMQHFYLYFFFALFKVIFLLFFRLNAAPFHSFFFFTWEFLEIAKQLWASPFSEGRRTKGFHTFSSTIFFYQVLTKILGSVCQLFSVVFATVLFVKKRQKRHSNIFDRKRTFAVLFA